MAAVSRDAAHRFSKHPVVQVRLVAGLGVQDDAHAGPTVQHRSRVAVDPLQPNLRQVHLIPAELLSGLAAIGYDIAPGQLGENVLTIGVDLMCLPRATRLGLGEHAVVELTGLRNPCRQIDEFRPGLLREVVGRAADGSVVRRAGVMAVVITSGIVRPGDAVAVQLPTGPHVALDRV
ncbi:MOSC domain-containing protein [Blastococcus haudaquaticus]|uniref:MOSC domain-containing protein YiiM n=1 Tax=Blastococcus haudaquaticus TaxID=1938745 RepID=A0A286GC00_9ACTN|nr:MOSC domain-containing protein [Blastococcus haudaquaticus]SOD93031.1 MOSC domain-containing protein YiiM [Blastococcus haudaquaticus]